MQASSSAGNTRKLITPRASRRGNLDISPVILQADSALQDYHNNTLCFLRKFVVIRYDCNGNVMQSGMIMFQLLLCGALEICGHMCLVVMRPWC